MKTKLSFFCAAFFCCTAWPQAPTITGDLLLCPNTDGTASITNSQVYDSYTWYWRYWFTSDPYVAIPGANGPSFTYDWMTYDQAQLKVVVTLGGNTYESNVIQIDSYAWVGLTTGFENTPNVSIDNNNGNVLLCQGTGFTLQTYLPYDIVQWYKDGLPIPGATSMELHITEPGSYYVVAAPSFCPDSTSSTEGLPTVVEIDTDCGLGTGHQQETLFSISPNPVKDLVTMSSAQPLENVAVYNLMGQKVLEQPVQTASPEINLAGLSSGIYLLEAKSGGKSQQMKIIKE